MKKIKVSELKSFDICDHLKTMEDVRDWLAVSLENDESIDYFKHVIDVAIKSIDKNISKMN